MFTQLNIMTMRSEANLIGAIQPFNLPSEIFTQLIRSVFFIYLGQVIGFTESDILTGR
jgi:hypothetical protein